MKSVFSGGVYLGKNTAQSASVQAKRVRAAGCISFEEMLAFLRACVETLDTRKRHREDLCAALCLKNQS